MIDLPEVVVKWLDLMAKDGDPLGMRPHYEGLARIAYHAGIEEAAKLLDAERNDEWLGIAERNYAGSIAHRIRQKNQTA